MKIQPLGNIVQLEFEEATAGDLITSSRESAVEYAKVVAIGDEVKDIKVGDNLFVKAFGIDIINYNDKKYYFCHLDTGAVLAICK